ncbi:MAG: hypothetical protein GY759_24225 [Chloroflexi bacterium]|nr:hypothetical protein [Chloroflexota bacterium]
MNFPTGLLTFAHRGASVHAPENTLPAFELAADMGADMGADGIEFDVQISADGQLIVHHDRELGRTEPATDPV